MKKFGIIFLAGVILLLALGFGFHQIVKTTEEVVTVTDKERIVESNGDGDTTSKYLVFTESETFENTDALFFGKFNSSDIQGKLRKDSTYNMRVVGWRIQWLSQYRNIISVE